MTSQSGKTSFICGIAIGVVVASGICKYLSSSSSRKEEQPQQQLLSSSSSSSSSSPPTLLVCDVQEELRKSASMATKVEPVIHRIRRLMDVARLLSMKVVIGEYEAARFGTTVIELVESRLPDDDDAVTTVQRRCFSLAPSLSPPSSSSSKNVFIVTGIESHVSVLQTVLDLLKDDGDGRRRRVYVATDCIASQHDVDTEVALATMRQHGAYCLTSEAIVFMLLKTSEHQHFKSVAALLRRVAEPVAVRAHRRGDTVMHGGGGGGGGV